MRPPFHVSVRPDDAASLPARPGVVSFETADGEAALVASTGDVRAFAVKRLSADGPRVDLGPVTRWLRAVVCASSFEADGAYLEWARELAPRTYRAAVDRWRGWFLRLDADADLPVWKKTNLADAADAADGGAAEDPATLVGPINGKDPAARFGETLDDLFELCREPRLLAQRPDATACAYKEMGKCPAPCDGSEPMAAYRSRVRAAVAMCSGADGRGIGGAIEAIGGEMKAAAQDMAFERAAELRVRGEALERLRGRPFRAVTTLDRFAVLAVLPAGRAGWARLMWHGAGETLWVGDVRAGARSGVGDAERAASLLDGPRARCGKPFDLSRPAVERIGLVCHHLFSGRRSRSTLLAVSDDVALSDLAVALRRAAKVEADEPDAEGPGEGGAAASPGGQEC